MSSIICKNCVFYVPVRLNSDRRDLSVVPAQLQVGTCYGMPPAIVVLPRSETVVTPIGAEASRSLVVAPSSVRPNVLATDVGCSLFTDETASSEEETQ